MNKYFYDTFSANELLTILSYGAFVVSSPASDIISCSLSNADSFKTGVSLQASISLYF